MTVSLTKGCAMPSPYSLDLRKRVIAACDEGREPPRDRRAVPRGREHHLRVAPASADQSYHSLPPKPHTGKPVSRLDTAVLSELSVEKAGCRVILLPPYTPEWNPVESCWSKMKELLRAWAARTLETLETVVVDAMDAVSAQDAHGWFRHCGYKVALD